MKDCTVTLRETGILLGSLLLDESEWQSLSRAPIFSIRIDDHPETDGWVTKHPDGTETTESFTIPLRPVSVPPGALAHGRALEEWVWHVHGAGGRLMLWDSSRRWWLAHEPDLELALLCAPDGLFRAESDDLSWWSFGADEGKQAVDALRARYGIVA